MPNVESSAAVGLSIEMKIDRKKTTGADTSLYKMSLAKAGSKCGSTSRCLFETQAHSPVLRTPTAPIVAANAIQATERFPNLMRSEDRKGVNAMKSISARLI